MVFRVKQHVTKMGLESGWEDNNFSMKPCELHPLDILTFYIPAKIHLKFSSIKHLLDILYINLDPS
jgi:hypothetical protein